MTTISEKAVARYDAQRIAFELLATACGRAHYGNALRVAKDFPCLTADDRSVLDRFACGRFEVSDGDRLKEIAAKVRASDAGVAA